MLEDMLRLLRTTDLLPTADRGLRSLGLVRVARSYDGTQAAAAFLLGALVGAGIALLAAPMTGRELRDRVRDRLDERTPEPASH